MLLVDGYNVLNAWPEVALLKEEDLAHARDRLIAILSEFHALCGIRIILVFDAHQVRGGTERREECGGIEVIFTREGESADQWIEKFVSQARANSPGKAVPIFVTTSDWLEQRIVSALGAYRVTPSELHLELRRLKKESEKYTCENFDRIPLGNHLSEQIKSIFEGWRRLKN
ncbi:MAG: NYN domain-containing protein [Bacillota bacterium]|nr:NYN domain-containing protein [Bacillota bacterium]